MTSAPDPANMPSLVLANLNADALRVQLKYFHIGKSAGVIDLSRPPKCPYCHQPGHVDKYVGQQCPSRTCRWCGAFDAHAAKNCPTRVRCRKCREMGHVKDQCSYKLKDIPLGEVTCDLCERKGHIEEDCELQWRTPGQPMPWELDYMNAGLRLSCHECGEEGHLGNDCPSRPPYKSLDSSAWGTGRGQMSIRSQTEIFVKGAARHEPDSVDEDDDLPMNTFVRPKLPMPKGNGKIQIKAGSSFKSNKAPSRRSQNYALNQRDVQSSSGSFSGWNPVNGTYQTGSRPSPSSPYQAGYDIGFRAYQQAGSHRNNSTRSAPQGDLYRPMPSSAQNAWSRHRT